MFQAVTKLGQKIMDVDINDIVVSEVLRIFITARNGKPNEVRLHFYPLLLKWSEINIQYLYLDKVRINMIVINAEAKIYEKRKV